MADDLTLAQYSGEYIQETHHSSHYYLKWMISGDITYSYGYGLITERDLLYSYSSGQEADLVGKITDAIVDAGG